MRTWLLVLALFGAWAQTSRASACDCAPSDFVDSYRAAESVVRVRVGFSYPRDSASPTRRRVTAYVVQDYKTCLTAGSQVDLLFDEKDAGCVPPLRFGREVLVHGTLGGAKGPPSLWVTPCAANAAWKSLGAAQRTYLDERLRFVACGDRCADGRPPVQCLVDPCSVASCDVEGASCATNYCGGCTAVWTDPAGERVCEGEGACDYEAAGRRWFGRSPAECQRVRFACEPGEEPSFDACGCGCQPSASACRVGGCSGQLCVGPGEPDVSTCEWRDAYACYREASR